MVELKELGTVVVVVGKARNLPNKQRFGKQDPYVTVTLGEKKAKTHAIKRGGQHPDWDYEMRFPIMEDVDDLLAASAAGGDTITRKNKDKLPALPADKAEPGVVTPQSMANKSRKGKKGGGGKSMKVQCWADDPKEPELIGEVVVSLEEVLTKGETDEWYELRQKDKYCGELYMELTFYSNAAPPVKRDAPRPNLYGNGAQATPPRIGGMTHSVSGANLYQPPYSHPRPPGAHPPVPRPAVRHSASFQELGLPPQPSQPMSIPGQPEFPPGRHPAPHSVDSISHSMSTMSLAGQQANVYNSHRHSISHAPAPAALGSSSEQWVAAQQRLDAVQPAPQAVAPMNYYAGQQPPHQRANSLGVPAGYPQPSTTPIPGEYPPKAHTPSPFPQPQPSPAPAAYPQPPLTPAPAVAYPQPSHTPVPPHTPAPVQYAAVPPTAHTPQPYPPQVPQQPFTPPHQQQQPHASYSQYQATPPQAYGNAPTQPSYPPVPPPPQRTPSVPDISQWQTPPPTQQVNTNHAPVHDPYSQPQQHQQHPGQLQQYSAQASYAPRPSQTPLPPVQAPQAAPAAPQPVTASTSTGTYVPWYMQTDHQQQPVPPPPLSPQPQHLVGTTVSQMPAAPPTPVPPPPPPRPPRDSSGSGSWSQQPPAQLYAAQPPQAPTHYQQQQAPNAPPLPPLPPGYGNRPISPQPPLPQEPNGRQSFGQQGVYSNSPTYAPAHPGGLNVPPVPPRPPSARPASTQPSPNKPTSPPPGRRSTDAPWAHLMPGTDGQQPQTTQSPGYYNSAQDFRPTTVAPEGVVLPPPMPPQGGTQSNRDWRTYISSLSHSEQPPPPSPPGKPLPIPGARPASAAPPLPMPPQQYQAVPQQHDMSGWYGQPAQPAQQWQ